MKAFTVRVLDIVLLVDSKNMNYIHVDYIHSGKVFTKSVVGRLQNQEIYRQRLHPFREGIHKKNTNREFQYSLVGRLQRQELYRP